MRIQSDAFLGEFCGSKMAGDGLVIRESGVGFYFCAFVIRWQ